MSKINRSKDKIRAIIERTCARRAMLIFVTPYLRIESSFVGVSGDTVHAGVVEGQGEALYHLRASDIRIRFPHGHSFLEGATRVLGIGAFEGSKTLVLEMPKELCENDDRKSFRVGSGGLGSIVAKIRTAGAGTISAALVDVSVHGAKFSTKLGQRSNALKWGDRVGLTIPIPNVVTIDAEAVVRHIDDAGFGVQYVPGLAEHILEPLDSWIFRKREEEMGRLDSLLGGVGKGGGKASAKPDKRRVLIVTSDNEIENAVRRPLSDELLVLHSEPSAVSLETMLGEVPHLVILHIVGGDSNARRSLKFLAGMVPRNVPTLLLGSNIDGADLYELGIECKVATSILWSKERGLLVQRLVVGILRKHFGLGESPMVSIVS